MSAKMELLKKIAKENGVTIDQMAASAGISTATLYRKIKAGGGTFTVEQTEKIAACTKMTRDLCEFSGEDIRIGREEVSERCCTCTRRSTTTGTAP